MPFLLYSLSLVLYFMSKIAYSESIKKKNCISSNFDEFGEIIRDSSGDTCDSYKIPWCDQFNTCKEYKFDSTKCCGCQDDKNCNDSNYTETDSLGDGCANYKKVNGQKSPHCKLYNVCKDFIFDAS